MGVTKTLSSLNFAVNLWMQHIHAAHTLCFGMCKYNDASRARFWIASRYLVKVHE